MKKFIFLVLILNSPTVFCQPDSAAKKPSPAPRLDTISYYVVNNESISLSSGGAVYKVNDKIVSERQWKKMTMGASKIKTCTRCVVKTYDSNDTLVSIGLQNKKCTVGSYAEFFPNGKYKVTGQYKNNACGVKDGMWNYYNMSGKITEMELYKDGKLLRKTKM